MYSLINPKTSSTLHLLHQKADEDANQRSKISNESKSMAYLAVSPEVGKFLYFLAKTSGAQNIVEFGCSYGISAIYLGSAAKDNGGTVTTTELEPNKVEAAYKNLNEAGLRDLVKILEGDAIETLKTVESQIDFLFLDGWKDLYLPVFQLLKPKLKKGAIICADNADHRGGKPLINLLLKEESEFTASLLFDGRLLVSYFH